MPCNASSPVRHAAGGTTEYPSARRVMICVRRSMRTTLGQGCSDKCTFAAPLAAARTTCRVGAPVFEA